MGGFCFSAPKAVANSSDTFGGPYDPIGSLQQNYSDFYTMVSFEAADPLRDASSTTLPLLVEITQENGPWNTMQNSTSYTAMKTAFVVLTVVCLCVAAYQITPFFGANGMRYSMRAVVYFTGLVVLLSSLVLNPFSHLNVVQAVCNSLVWILSFAAYSWLIITWGQLVYRLRPLRYRLYLRWVYGIFMVDILICILLFAVYASLSSPKITSVVRPAIIFNIPPVFLASAGILFHFGYVFFTSYRNLIHQTTARTTMLKFSFLAYCTAFSFIMVAVTIMYFHFAPVNTDVIAYKSFCILYEITMYALFGPVFFALATSEMPEIDLQQLFNGQANFYVRRDNTRNDLERVSSRKSIRFIMANSSSHSRERCDSAESIHSFIHKPNTHDLSLTIIVPDGTAPPPSRSRRSSRHSQHPRNSMASSYSQRSTPSSPRTPVRPSPFMLKEEE
ncbi:hypothetical protein BDF22DRAFT_665131 [Syncephalis plumigaleata]|nr:hypothetical protein BDF22DRAFT_665131 [Syncephalis plumigaleata]